MSYPKNFKPKFKHTGYKPRCCKKQMKNEGYWHGAWHWLCTKCGKKKRQYD